MEKVIIFAGESEGRENYQLLVGTDYITFSYCQSDGSREAFLDSVSEEFARRIVKKKESSEVGVMNGHLINNGKLKRVGRLDTQSLEAKLKELLTQLNEKGIVIPADNLN